MWREPVEGALLSNSFLLRAFETVVRKSACVVKKRQHTRTEAVERLSALLAEFDGAPRARREARHTHPVRVVRPLSSERPCVPLLWRVLAWRSGALRARRAMRAALALELEGPDWDEVRRSKTPSQRGFSAAPSNRPRPIPHSSGRASSGGDQQPRRSNAPAGLFRKARDHHSMPSGARPSVPSGTRPSVPPTRPILGAAAVSQSPSTGTFAAANAAAEKSPPDAIDDASSATSRLATLVLC